MGLFQYRVHCHKCGKEGSEKEWEFISKDFSPILKSSYEFVPYFDQNLSDAYNAADVIVSRAGAGAIFECAAKGKPAVLIPFPDSANGHQQANAFEAQKAGMAIVIEQQNLLSNLFLSVIDGLLADAQKLAAMSAAARAFYKPEAASKIAEGITTLVASR
jgi:UDP-N-acetylglucosamine--N-acetylmuramyl-(pentapeptide) pyrophosphoryl-undecaprenol N-acetylglucosamine transferase